MTEEPIISTDAFIAYSRRRERASKFLRAAAFCFLVATVCLQQLQINRLRFVLRGVLVLQAKELLILSAHDAVLGGISTPPAPSSTENLALQITSRTP